MSDYLYRVQIVSFPEGAMKPSRQNPNFSYPDPTWEPAGWDPDEEWVERFGRDTGRQFFWPKTDRVYQSRSSAAKLRQLVESYGAKAIIQRSSRILWPGDGYAYLGDDLLERAKALRNGGAA